MDISPLTIGEFARLGGVSIKALRLYDKMGLLPPAVVKPASRYRLYTHSQLATLRRIQWLKAAGFALAGIRPQLATRDESSLGQIRLRLLERVEEIRRQLVWIDAELRSSAHVVVKRVPGLGVWSCRRTMDSYAEADTLLQNLARHVPPSARVVSGAVWHRCAGDGAGIEGEVFWVSSRRGRAATPGELGPVTVASILHEGDDSTIGGSYEAGHRWLHDQGYPITGPNRELYLAASLTEIQFPIG